MTPKQLHAELLRLIERGDYVIDAAKQMGFKSHYELYELFTPAQLSIVYDTVEHQNQVRTNKIRIRRELDRVRTKYIQEAEIHYNRLPNDVKTLADFIAESFNIRPTDLFLPTRNRHVTEPRFILQYVLKLVMDMTRKEVGILTCIYPLNRTTINNAIVVVQSICLTDDNYNSILHSATRMAKALKPIPFGWPKITALHAQTLH